MKPHLHGICVGAIAHLNPFMLESRQLETLDPSIHIIIQRSCLHDDSHGRFGLGLSCIAAEAAAAGRIVSLKSGFRGRVIGFGDRSDDIRDSSNQTGKPGEEMDHDSRH